MKKKKHISPAEEFCNTFLGGVAAAEGSETCTKSSEVQGGGGDVAGVPKGVPFPPAEKEHKLSSAGSSFLLSAEQCMRRIVHLNTISKHLLLKSLSAVYQHKSAVSQKLLQTLAPNSQISSQFASALL